MATKSADESNCVKQDLTRKERAIYSLRCRFCRTPLLSSNKIRVSHEINTQPRPQDCGNCLYLDEEDLPAWIQDQIGLCGWTKGRIHCPKKNCPARIGGFDFVQGLLCACGVLTIPAIWIQDGKVDVNIISSCSTSTFTQKANTTILDRRKLRNVSHCSFDSKVVDQKTSKIPENGKEQQLSTTVEGRHQDGMVDNRPSISEAASLDHCPDISKLPNNLGSEATSTASDVSKGPKIKKHKNDPENELKSIETGQHSKCYSSTFVLQERLLPSRNRFGNLKVEEPKVTLPPSMNVVDDHLTCPVCLDLFYKPYKCPCDHVFCEPCLRQLYHARCGTLKCPVCRSAVRYIEPANELRDEIKKFHNMLTKVREAFEKTARYKMWPLPPIGPLPFLKRYPPFVPSQDKKLITFAGILLSIVCCVILYIGLNLA